MAELYQGNCSLCAQVASYELVDAGKRKWFRCTNCKNFIITDSAERCIQSPALRQQLSQKSASLDEQKVLHIFVAEDQSVHVEVELKSKWLQWST